MAKRKFTKVSISVEIVYSCPIDYDDYDEAVCAANCIEKQVLAQISPSLRDEAWVMSKSIVEHDEEGYYTKTWKLD